MCVLLGSKVVYVLQMTNHLSLILCSFLAVDVALSSNALMNCCAWCSSGKMRMMFIWRGLQTFLLIWFAQFCWKQPSKVCNKFCFFVMKNICSCSFKLYWAYIFNNYDQEFGIATLLLSFFGSLFCIKILRCLVHFFLVWQKAQGILYRKAPREHVATLSMHVVLRPLHAYTDAPLPNEKKCSKIHRC